jgi:hypothetical protein
MDAETWNREHPIGTRIMVRLANGDILHTWTTSAALRVSSLDFVRIRAFEGLVLLSWCEALPEGL